MDFGSVDLRGEKCGFIEYSFDEEVLFLQSTATLIRTIIKVLCTATYRRTSVGLVSRKYPESGLAAGGASDILFCVTTRTTR